MLQKLWNTHFHSLRVELHIVQPRQDRTQVKQVSGTHKAGVIDLSSGTQCGCIVHKKLSFWIENYCSKTQAPLTRNRFQFPYWNSLETLSPHLISIVFVPDDSLQFHKAWGLMKWMRIHIDYPCFLGPNTHFTWNPFGLGLQNTKKNLED